MPFDQPDPADRIGLHHERRAHLQALAATLEVTTKFRVAVLPSSDRPPLVLEVVNPFAPNLSETIACDHIGREWWFVWSWGDRIARVTELDKTAEAIRHVLASTA